MKRRHATAWLVLGVCVLSVTSGNAQNQTHAATDTQTNRTQILEHLQERLQAITAEIAAIREQANVPQSPDSQRRLSQRADRVEIDLRHVKDELNALEAREGIEKIAASPTRSDCCESAEVHTADERVQMEGTEQCKKANAKATTGVQSTFVRDAVSATCPTGRVIQSQRAGAFEINLVNNRGLLTKGENEFCIEFRSIRDNNPANPGEVRAEATMAIGQIKAVRAVVRLSRANVDRYCAHVNLSLPGVWTVAVKHRGSLGKGEAVFLAMVN